MSNTIGKIFKFTSFGESHGKCVGVVVDGVPAGLKLSEADIQKELDKRRPGQSGITTSRKEKDKGEILSGVFNGFTTGAPVCILVRNQDVDSSKYEKMKDLMRPGHADFTSFVKYGGFGDYRGGGRFSGRQTAGFVMVGALAKKILRKILNIEILAHTVEIGGVRAKEVDLEKIKLNTGKNIVRCADPESAKQMISKIEEAKREGDSVGGVVEGVVLNAPPGLGEPIFDTLEGDLAKALFAIPAVKGVEFGAGFRAAKLKGSQNNDEFYLKKEKIVTSTNNCGGILGGISNGMPIVLRVAFKPTPSISKVQETVHVKKMKEGKIKIEGRHDPCIVPRAVPVVEAMIGVVLCDFAIRAHLIPSVIEDDKDNSSRKKD